MTDDEHELRWRLAEGKTAAIRSENKLNQILAIVKEY